MTSSSSYLTHISMEKVSPNTIPVGLGLVQILLLQIIIDLVRRTWKYFSRSYSYLQSQISLLDNSKFDSSKKKEDSEWSNNTNKQRLKVKDDHTTICRVEGVMERLEFFCHPQDGKLLERIGYGFISQMFDEEEPSLYEVKEAFDVFDQNRDGYIDANELQRVLCCLGLKEGLDMENCKKMIDLFDENEDERMDFNEFVKLTKKCLS